MTRYIKLDRESPDTWHDDDVMQVLMGARDDLFASARGRRNSALATAGRKPNPQPCPHGCGESFSGRVYRAHLPICPARQLS